MSFGREVDHPQGRHFAGFIEFEIASFICYQLYRFVAPARCDVSNLGDRKPDNILREAGSRRIWFRQGARVLEIGQSPLMPMIPLPQVSLR